MWVYLEGFVLSVGAGADAGGLNTQTSSNPEWAGCLRHHALQTGTVLPVGPHVQAGRNAVAEDECDKNKGEDESLSPTSRQSATSEIETAELKMHCRSLTTWECPLVSASLSYFSWFCI